MFSKIVNKVLKNQKINHDDVKMKNSKAKNVESGSCACCGCGGGDC